LREPHFPRPVAVVVGDLVHASGLSEATTHCGRLVKGEQDLKVSIERLVELPAETIERREVRIADKASVKQVTDKEYRLAD
jgi:hypothetical protein